MKLIHPTLLSLISLASSSAIPSLLDPNIEIQVQQTPITPLDFSGHCVESGTTKRYPIEIYNTLDTLLEAETDRVWTRLVACGKTMSMSQCTLIAKWTRGSACSGTCWNQFNGAIKETARMGNGAAKCWYGNEENTANAAIFEWSVVESV